MIGHERFVLKSKFMNLASMLLFLCESMSIKFPTVSLLSSPTSNLSFERFSLSTCDILSWFQFVSATITTRSKVSHLNHITLLQSVLLGIIPYELT
jgi:hypothetical protein